MAYCLLGLFKIYMPLIYGEGDEAFFRLQQEIIKQSEDESIFAWDMGLDGGGQTLPFSGLFAPSPCSFANSRTMRRFSGKRPPWSMTNKGFAIHVPNSNINADGTASLRLTCFRKRNHQLDCGSDPSHLGPLAVQISLKKGVTGIYYRWKPNEWLEDRAPLVEELKDTTCIYMEGRAGKTEDVAFIERR